MKMSIGLQKIGGLIYDMRSVPLCFRAGNGTYARNIFVHDTYG